MSETVNEMTDLGVWRPFECHIGGDPKRVASMEVRRMNAPAAAPFKRALKKARDAYRAVLPVSELEAMKQATADGEAKLKAQRALSGGDDDGLLSLTQSFLEEVQEYRRRDDEATAAFFEAFPEDVLRRTFERCVRKVSMVVDGQAITDPRQMYEVADYGLTLAVINKLENLCTLTEQEGKASSSLSTSDAATTAGSGDSPANSIESEGGPTPSTATETPSAT